MRSLESLKQHLNNLYGRSAYELKTPVYIDNRNKNIMEEEFMSKAIPVSNPYVSTDYLTSSLQQGIYKALRDASTREDEKKAKSYDTPEEKWVWVTGYKGLDKDMKAYGGFQYEMDKLYIMPEGEPVEACHGGFHMCLNLKDLYNYKSIGGGNRFFECSALVRESDLEKYGKKDGSLKWMNIAFMGGSVNKLAAKSIRLVRELSIDEILDHMSEAGLWPEYIKQIAVRENVEKAETEWHIVVLTRMGYARPLAEYIVKDRNGDDGYKLAVALDSQTDISMDTKINAIFNHI